MYAANQIWAFDILDKFSILDVLCCENNNENKIPLQNINSGGTNIKKYRFNVFIIYFLKFGYFVCLFIFFLFDTGGIWKNLLCL